MYRNLQICLLKTCGVFSVLPLRGYSKRVGRCWWRKKKRHRAEWSAAIRRSSCILGANVGPGWAVPPAIDRDLQLPGFACCSVEDRIWDVSQSGNIEAVAPPCSPFSQLVQESDELWRDLSICQMNTQKLVRANQRVFVLTGRYVFTSNNLTRTHTHHLCQQLRRVRWVEKPCGN